MDSRKAMIVSAALLLRRHGYTGTGFRDVIAHSGAPRGSIYHHFPDGKDQLAAAAVEYAGEFSARAIEQATTSERAVQAFIEFWKQTLVSSDFKDGCPVVAVAVEDHGESRLAAEAAAGAFRRWEQQLTDILVGEGAEPEHARDVAATIIAAVEGAIVYCRAVRSVEPLDRVARILDTLR